VLGKPTETFTAAPCIHLPQRLGRDYLPLPLATILMNSNIFNTVYKRTLVFDNGFYLKKYFFGDAKLIRDNSQRLDHLRRVCQKNSATPTIEWFHEDYCLIQKSSYIIGEKPLALSAKNKLEDFSRSLDLLNLNKFSHGDLNRKNIIEDQHGLYLIDFEPVLEIPYKSSSVIMRGTEPYIHPLDRKNKKLTLLSDLLGFSCFSQWCFGLYSRPSFAVNNHIINNVLFFSMLENPFYSLYKYLLQSHEREI